MCPACIASTAVMVAGAGSTGGILAVCIGRFRKLFRAKGLFQKAKEFSMTVPVTTKDENERRQE